MISLVFALLLATSPLEDRESIPRFEAVLGGNSNLCVHFLNCSKEGVEWRGQFNKFRETRFTLIAAARGGHFFAAASSYAYVVEIVELNPEGESGQVFRGLFGYHALAMTIDAAGTFHLLVESSTSLAVASIDRDGVLLGLHLIDPSNLSTNAVWGSIHLAADQCTLFLVDQRTAAIRRYDLCRHTFLSDFAVIRDGYLRSVVLLPDGGALAAVSPPNVFYKDHVRRYDASGAETARYYFPDARFYAGPMAVDGDWRVLASGANSDLGGDVYRIDLARGTMTKALDITNINGPYSLVPLAGWTPAIGFTGATRRRAAGH
jgi:hypothetical protein